MTQDPQNKASSQYPQDQKIDLNKKIQEAKEKAEKDEQSGTNDLNEMRAHSASAQDEQGSGSASPSESELIKIQLEQMTEMAKRTMADLHNLKRRQEEERRLIITMANVDIILGLLPILNNLERSRQHLPENLLKDEKNKEWFQGIEMCITQFQKVLTDAGLKPIESIGQTFNPDLHEALVQGPGPQNIILEELEKGYMLGERVIRHAKVKVGNGESTSKTP